MDHLAGMLAKFELKFPEHAMRQKAFGIEDLEDVDLVVSLFGRASSFAPDLIFSLVSSGVKYFLMFHHQGYGPVTYDITAVNLGHYAFASFNLPSEDFGSFAIVTNLRMPCGSLAFPRLTRREGPRARTLPGSISQGEHLPMEAGHTCFLERQDDQKARVKMEKGASLGGTVLTLLNASMGAGVLVLPYAWRLAGWMFVIPFFGIALLMGFTLWLSGFLLKVVDSRAAEMGVPQASRGSAAL